MVKCWSCGNEGSRENAKFCDECGRPLTLPQTSTATDRSVLCPNITTNGQVCQKPLQKSNTVCQYCNWQINPVIFQPGSRPCTTRYSDGGVCDGIVGDGAYCTVCCKPVQQVTDNDSDGRKNYEGKGGASYDYPPPIQLSDRQYHAPVQNLQPHSHSQTAQPSDWHVENESLLRKGDSSISRMPHSEKDFDSSTEPCGNLTQTEGETPKNEMFSTGQRISEEIADKYTSSSGFNSGFQNSKLSNLIEAVGNVQGQLNIGGREELSGKPTGMDGEKVEAPSCSIEDPQNLHTQETVNAEETDASKSSGLTAVTEHNNENLNVEEHKAVFRYVPEKSSTCTEPVELHPAADSIMSYSEALQRSSIFSVDKDVQTGMNTGQVMEDVAQKSDNNSMKIQDGGGSVEMTAKSVYESEDNSDTDESESDETDEVNNQKCDEKLDTHGKSKQSKSQIDREKKRKRKQDSKARKIAKKQIEDPSSPTAPAVDDCDPSVNVQRVKSSQAKNRGKVGDANLNLETDVPSQADVTDEKNKTTKVMNDEVQDGKPNTAKETDSNNGPNTRSKTAAKTESAQRTSTSADNNRGPGTGTGINKNEPEEGRSKIEPKRQDGIKHGETKEQRHTNTNAMPSSVGNWHQMQDIVVTFHGILAPTFIQDISQKVCICIPPNTLLESKLVRVHKKSYVEYETTLYLSRQIANNRYCYWYMIITPQGNVEEYVSDYNRSNIGRFLYIPADKLKTGVFHQYDGIVDVEPIVWFSRVPFIGQQIKDRKVSTYAEKAFCIFWEKQMSDFEIEEVTAEEFLDRVIDITRGLGNVYSSTMGLWYSHEDFDKFIGKILKPYLEEMTEKNQKSSKSSHKIAVTIVWLLAAYHVEDFKHTGWLCEQMIVVEPVAKEKTCRDINNLKEQFPNNMNGLRNVVQNFVNNLAGEKCNARWLLCVPLLHFMWDKCKPYEKPGIEIGHCDAKPEWWGVVEYRSKNDAFRNKISWNKKLEEIFEKLCPMFPVDYFLPRTLMTVLKLEDLEKANIVERFPVEVCLAKVYHHLTEIHYGQKGDHEKIQKLLKKISQSIRHGSSVDSDFNDILATLYRIFMIGYNVFLEALRWSNKGSHYTICYVAQVVLYTLASFGNIVSNNTKEHTFTFQRDYLELFDEFREKLRSWLQKNFYMFKVDKCLDSLKLWNLLMETELPKGDINTCFSSFLKEQLQSLISSKMSTHAGVIIDVYCQYENQFGSSLQGILVKFAMEALKQGSGSQLWLQDRSGDSYGKLLSYVFEKHWTKLEEGELFTKALEWTPFEHFLHMFYQEKRSDALKMECQFQLTRAASLLTKKLDLLEEGSICVGDLKLISAKFDMFKTLMKTMFAKSKDETQMEKNDSYFDSLIKIREIELEAFLANLQNVKGFLDMCIRIEGVDITSIQTMVSGFVKLDDIALNVLCHPEKPSNLEHPHQYRPKVIALGFQEDILALLPNILQNKDSSVFIVKWDDIGNKVTKQKGGKITVQETIDEVWIPLQRWWCQQCQQIESGKMLFQDFQSIFKQMDEEKLHAEFTLMSRNGNTKWINERLTQIRQYRELQECVAGARAILRVVDSYELKGDFDLIRKITDVDEGTAMNMNEMNESMIEACSVLRGFTKEHADCLEKFISCKELVLWLRKSMKSGLKELKVFVDLASISAGEGDMELAKVQCLHAATTGYAPLIFNLSDDIDCSEFLGKCKLVWKELQTDPDLPKKLDATKRQLRWLETVQKAHGSVEITSFAQAEAINSVGVYQIGKVKEFKGNKQDLDDVISLHVIEDEQSSRSQKEYQYRQLHDLQSRLMLVAGKAEQGKGEVDRFTMILDSVVRLGNVYTKLLSAGCVLFSDWKAQLLCDKTRTACCIITFGEGKNTQKLKGRKESEEDEVSSIIPHVAKFMENCWTEWLQYIDEKRDRYYHLNFFTIDQMVILQKELVKIGTDKKPSDLIFPLLSAVKKDCSLQDIVEAMKEAQQQVETMDQEYEENKNDSGDEEEIEVDENEDTNAFIKELTQTGFTEALARKALQHFKLDQMDEAVVWCMDNDEASEEGEKDMHDKKTDSRGDEDSRDDEVYAHTILNDDSTREFIQELTDAGYTEALAKKALRHFKPDEVADAVVWCMDHEGEEESEEESIPDDGEKEEEEEESMYDEMNPQIVAFPGWTSNQKTVSEVTTAIVGGHLPVNQEISVASLIKGLKQVWETFLNSVSSSVSDYLSVEHLGLILQKLAEREEFLVKRKFLSAFKTGIPNLVICPQDELLHTVLTIYMYDKMQPLPQPDEVLICSSNTTLDQLDTFWRRAVFTTSGRIHCLVNGDLLDYDVSDKGDQCLEQHMEKANEQGIDYRLVVLCSTENENKSRIVAALDRFRRPHLPVANRQAIRQYLQNQFRVDNITGKMVPAARVDFDQLAVRVVKSRRAGVGKTLYKKRLEAELNRLYSTVRRKSEAVVTIPLHEREIDVDAIMSRLLECTLQPGHIEPRIFHIDISHEVYVGVDAFLFHLLILGCLSNSAGYVWRKSPYDHYLVETMPRLSFDRTSNEKGVFYMQRCFDILPDVTCKSPEESLYILKREENPTDLGRHGRLFDHEEFCGPVFQRPYQYLKHLDENQTLSDIDPNEPQGDEINCLQTLLRHCGMRDPSWAELNHFVWFLNTQLQDFEVSPFCGSAAVEDLPGFAKFVLKFLIQMSRDFATRSLKLSEESPEAELEDEENEGNDTEEELLQMRRTWESSPHPYIFFNPDHNSMTFLGFNIDRGTGNLVDLQTGTVLERSIMDKNLQDSLIRNRVNINEDFDALPRGDKIQKLCSVMGMDMPYDPDETYELTTDNVKKILAIYMRFKCDIPVIIMGETGCGKTRLVKFMCSLQCPPGVEIQNMILMKVHGGTKSCDIMKKVRNAEEIAKQNVEEYGEHLQTVLFFDEANTTEAIGLIKEIMCDKTLGGKPLKLSQSLKIIAACNPYRKHSDELIKRLEQAGLGYHVDADLTVDRLGRIPMRRLVYRVQPLPQSLLPLVWDFGQLDRRVEELYIRQMVLRYINSGKLPQNIENVVSRILTVSQNFMREQEDECSFVSLRDVERVLRVMTWFYGQATGSSSLFELLRTNDDDTEEEEDEDEDENQVEEVSIGLSDVTRSLILALGVCYHACLKKRKKYRKAIAQQFTNPCPLPGGADRILQEIERCQEVFLNNVQLGKNIAQNQALKENVFMMVTCIELRIPLFLVGKPGSSKSLAKTIVADAMQGHAAHKQLFKEYKAAQMVSFQCSPLSVPEGIVGTFRQCATFQKDRDLDTFVSVVVLDEVGLAEDSPRMPLKTLHPLLEDGCEGDEEPEPYKKVAFIGISNWALDPAKMNRGILVQREVPELKELTQSAEGICSSDQAVYGMMKTLIRSMAKSYLDLFKEASDQLREFYGLRDFYSLLKMVYAFADKNRKKPSWKQLEHAILRNFGGMEGIDPVKVFAKNLANVDTNEKPLETDPDCTPAGLIQACLGGDGTQSESRYLLLLTENYGALAILQQKILTMHNAITIFGSSFPSDQEYTQICRNINRIKVCMETGSTVVLLNLENLYESLYDALNQYYVEFGGERYVDLGLGSHRVKCRVHKQFRLIVVAEKQTVYHKFPIPLINRLEKHFLNISTMLTPVQLKLAEKLESWTKDFAEIKTHHFTGARRNRTSKVNVSDVFIGYHADMCAAVILHVIQEQNLDADADDLKILELAKELMVWSATPDSVMRLSKTPLNSKKDFMFDLYFKKQQHECLAQYLAHRQKQSTGIVFAQITTHSKLITTVDLGELSEVLKIPPQNMVLLTLQSFDTEQQFCRQIRNCFKNSQGKESLLVVQSDCGDQNSSLVACARYCIQDELQEIGNSSVHVVFIIQLPRIAGGCFSGFQCGLWHSLHIDDLRPQGADMLTVLEMQGKSLGMLVHGAIGTENSMEDTDSYEISAMETWSSEDNFMIDEDGHRDEHTQMKVDEDDIHMNRVYDLTRSHHRLHVHSLIFNCIQAALAMVKDSQELKQRETERVALMLHLLQQTDHMSKTEMLLGLNKHLDLLLQEREKNSTNPNDWLASEAARAENINTAGTFRRALIQCMEAKVTPILAGIIAFIDTNSNLDCLSRSASDSWRHQLWMEVINCPQATGMQYNTQLVSPGRNAEVTEVMVSHTGAEGHLFTGDMPFSWLIFRLIEDTIKTSYTAITDNEQGSTDVIMKTRDVVISTSLGNVLQPILVQNVKETTQAYLSDFVHMVYPVKTLKECQLVCESLYIGTRPLLEADFGDALAQIIGFHISYRHYAQRLKTFSSLNTVWPDCSQAIVDFKSSSNSYLLTEEEMTLDVIGLKLLLERLVPEKDTLNEARGRNEWLTQVHLYRPVVERILDFMHSSPETAKYGTRCCRTIEETKRIWTRVIVVKLFVEHVCSMDSIEKDNLMVKRVMPLWTMMKSGVDMKKVESLGKVEKFLKTCNKSTVSKIFEIREGNPMSDEQQLPSCPHIHELPGVCLGSQEQAQIASNEISTENKGQVSGTEQNQMCVRPIQTQDEITTGLLSAHSTPANFPVQYDGTQCIEDIPLYFHDDNDLHEEYAGAPDPNEDEGRGTFEEPMEIVTSDDADEEDNNENECHNIDIARSNEDPPLYVIPPSNSLYKCQVSHSEYVLSASALASRYKMSAKMIRDVMKFSQLIMPENNLCDTSFEQLQRSCGFDASYLKYHLYCIRCKKLFDMDSEEENCKTPGCGNTKSDKNCYFVTGSLQIQLKEVLERKGMWPSIKESTSGGDVISDIKNGQGYRELQKSGGFLDNTNNITLSLFIDGIPLYSSSSVSLWPVYLLINEISPKERFKKKNMLLWGVWQGVGKPNMNMFLRPLVVDLIKLYTDGIPISVQTEVGKNEEFKEVIVKAMLVVATMDLQARAYVTNMTQHNGENGCLYCMEPGQMVPSGKAFCRAYLPREQSPKLRTDDEARESAITAQETNSRTSGFMGESVLWYLPYFSMTNSIVIDYMHGTLLGVTKKFLYYWFDTKFSNKEFYIGKNIKDVDKALREIRPPYIIHRLPRILSDTYHHWKASELRNWLLFYSIPCLQNILPDVYLTHFSCLVEGTYLLLTEGLTMDDVSRADLLLQTFVKNVQILYGDSAMSLNVHNLTHLVKFVKQWGPLWAWSCFPFESFNGEIKQSVHGTGNVCKQIFWSLQSQKRVESRSSQVSSSKVQEFLKSLLNPRSETFTSDCEAYQCSVVKSSSSSVLLPDEVKEDLKEKAGTDVESHYISISKIARNGFQMYSKSCLRVKKQNSYTIKLERPFKTNDILCDIVEVQSYVMVKSSRKVFAIGSVMKSSGSIIPHRIPHMQKIEPVGNEIKCKQCETHFEGPPVTLLPCNHTICTKCWKEMKATKNLECPICYENIVKDFDPAEQKTDHKKYTKYNDYKRRCNSFFIEVVSQLCFADGTAPDSDVVEKLMKYITRETKSQKVVTKEMSIFDDDIDPTPVLRSFLLQLVLSTSGQQVRQYLQNYMDQASQFVDAKSAENQEYRKLCLLIIQCIEDSYHQEISKSEKQEEDEISMALGMLRNAKDIIEMEETSVLQTLEALAGTRFSLIVVAKYVQEIFVVKSRKINQTLRHLIDAAAQLCQECGTKWPCIFFIKQLCRCYGLQSYEVVSNSGNASICRWMRSLNLKRDEKFECSDSYVVCGQQYIDLREMITKCLMGENVESLEEKLRNIEGHDWQKRTWLLLSVHREITMLNVYPEDRPPTVQKTVEPVIDCLKRMKLFDREQWSYAEKMIENSVWRHCDRLNINQGLSLHDQQIPCLLVHALITFCQLPGDRTLLQPLKSLAFHPQNFVTAYLPTMPQDDILEMKQALLQGRTLLPNENPIFYRCPNGHPYVIGDCGRPYYTAFCKDCGATIGGKRHELEMGNVKDAGEDKTQPGHILGRAERRTAVAQPERTMSPVGCAILRLLTHIAMILGANENLQAVCSMITPNIEENEVHEFLLSHIQLDITIIQKATGYSSDDVVLLIHKLLSNATNTHDQGHVRQSFGSLTSKDSRNKWEGKFTDQHITPLLQNIDQDLKENNRLVAGDERLGSDPLMCLLYEIDSADTEENTNNLSDMPAVWRYRKRISMDHMATEFQSHMKDNYKVLQLFLKEEQKLRTLRLVPSIMRLQKLLIQKYQRKLDRTEANTDWSLAKVIADFRKDGKEEEVEQLFWEFGKAWNCVRESLSTFPFLTRDGIVTVPREYCCRQISMDTNVSMLLPSHRDDGMCSYALLYYLLKKQNSFLDKYCEARKQKTEDLPKVKVADITPAHLISYHPDKDILSIVLANCNYSFEVGQGTTITYDFQNIERQLMDRFLFSKSYIEIDEIELMTFRSDATNSAVFTSLRRKIKQEQLVSAVRRQISEEFRSSLPEICDCLDNLDITISFLKSVGEKSDCLLETFMTETLKLKNSLFSQKARQVCQCKHAQSLWTTLSLEKTKCLAMHHQNAFEGVGPELREDLTDNQTKELQHFCDELQIDKLDVLIECLFECLMLRLTIAQNPEDEDYVDVQKISLKDYLMAYMDSPPYDQDVIYPAWMMDVVGKLPSDLEEVQVSHAVAVWLCLHESYMRKGSERQR